MTHHLLPLSPLPDHNYDDNGNLLSQLDVNSTAIVTHTYDGFNRLVSSVTGEGTITYTYNAQGIRTSRTVGVTTTDYLLDGGNVIGEVTGDETYTYVRGANLIFGRARYYLYNAHGDVVQLTNTNGQLTKNYNYDAFVGGIGGFVGGSGGGSKYMNSLGKRFFKRIGEALKYKAGEFLKAELLGAITHYLKSASKELISIIHGILRSYIPAITKIGVEWIDKQFEPYMG